MYRFDAANNPTGCRAKWHTPIIENDGQQSDLELYQKYTCIHPPEPYTPPEPTTSQSHRISMFALDEFIAGVDLHAAGVDSARGDERVSEDVKLEMAKIKTSRNAMKSAVPKPENKKQERELLGADEESSGDEEYLSLSLSHHERHRNRHSKAANEVVHVRMENADCTLNDGNLRTLDPKSSGEPNVHAIASRRKPVWRKGRSMTFNIDSQRFVGFFVYIFYL